MSTEATDTRGTRLLLGSPGLVLAGLWGFAESTLFFVVPDVQFTLAAAFRPARALAQLVLATAGAVLGGWLMYAWAESAPGGARAAVARVPAVGERMLAETEARLAARGTAALFDRPLGGVPYKVYAVLAPAHFPAAHFLLLSPLARIERFAFSWLGFALLGRLLARRARAGHVLALHAFSWTAFYLWFWFLR